MRTGMDKKRLGILLTVWLAANFLPHALVFLFTGGLSYRLSPVWMLTAEWAVMLLNLSLPPAADYFLLKERGSVAENFGWKWKGWRTPAYGAAGLVIFIGVAFLTQHSIGDPISSPAQRFSTISELLLLLLLLLGLTAPAEETMFRGWLQRHFIRAYGVWPGIALAALLFGLRYLPMDLYGGVSQHAPLSAWASRMLELYALAFVLGIVRHYARSTWASWLVREAVLLLVVILAVVAGLG
jgi:membrane protease YdiL (CAAX protease family)